MLILQRYVFKELILPFSLSVLILNFIFMGGYLVKAAQFIIGRAVPFQETLYILMLAMPEMVGYTVPTSILMAVLMVFGSLSQNNELRAIKASGIHLGKVLFPAFVVGIVLSLSMMVFNDQVASNAGFVLRKTMKKMIIKFPKALIEPGRFVKLNSSITFLAKEVKDDELLDIVAYETEDRDKPIRTIIAERGEIFTDDESGEVKIQLFNGSISDAEDEGVHTMQFKTYEFPTIGQEDIRNMQKKKKDLTLAEIIVTLGKDNNNEEDILDLKTAFHERLAFSCGSFIFVLIGLPVAVLVRRGEIVLSFGVAMATACCYYILFAGAKTVAHEGIVPPFIALWAPNAVLFGLGFYLVRKAFRA